MRELKESGIEWIKNMPADWTLRRGKYVFELLSRPVTETDGIITCFRDGEVTLRSNRREDGFTMSDKEIGYQGIEPGDLVVHGMDGFAGSIGISDSRGKGSPILNVLDSNEDKHYMMYYLRAMAYGNVFTAIATGIRVRSCDLRWPKLANLPYPIPVIKEQRAIANFLDNQCAAIDGAIERHKGIIEKLEEYRRAYIIAAATGRLTYVDFKDSGIPWLPKIPKNWDVIPLKFIFGERKHKNTNMIEKNLLSLSYGRIKRKDIEMKEGLLPESFDGYNIVEKGDIVLRLTDLQNDKKSLRTGYVTERGIITSAYISLRPLCSVNSEYYRYLLHSYDLCKVFYTMGEGIRQSLKYDEIAKGINLPVFSLDEQTAICEKIHIVERKTDDAIKRQKDAITKLEEYRKSIIYNAVTGKIDCRKEQ